MSPRGIGPSSPSHKLPASYAGDKWGSEMLARNSPDAKERKYRVLHAPNNLELFLPDTDLKN